MQSLQPRKSLRVIAISDTHSSYPKNLPPGDMLIHCGDFCSHGGLGEVQAFCGWLSTLPYKYKIVIPGNHDTSLDGKSFKALQKDFGLNEGDAEKGKALMKQVCTYLEHEMVEIEGVRIFGSPYTPDFYNWAFMYPPKDGQYIWDIPHKEIDILVTHGPPLGILDRVARGNAGCPDLLDLVKKVKPKFHLFGHIHEAYGEEKDQHTQYYNCSLKNLQYRLVNKPFVFDIPLP